MSQVIIQPLRRILLATDFSASSERARDYAAIIAARTDARIDVVHVVVPFSDAYDFAGVSASTMVDRQVQEAAEQRITGYIKPLGQAATYSVTRNVQAAEGIIERARENDADIIVVGTQGRTGIARFLLGSVAGEVVRRSGRPTLVVNREGDEQTEMNSIVAAVDFSEASRHALHQAADLALLHDARLTAIHVVDSAPLPPYYADDFRDAAQDSARAHLQQFIDDEDLVVDPDPIVVVGAPHREIPAVARSVGADLIVMGVKGLSALEGVLVGSVTDRVLRHAPCAVLAHTGQQVTEL